MIARGRGPVVPASLVALLVALWAAPAGAFELPGHEIIEATAYKRLLAMPAVPVAVAGGGAGAQTVSGRLLLARLIASGVLLPPPCFGASAGDDGCGPADRLALPLGFWPLLGSGTPDLVLDRQLGQRGQCQHFMARTADGMSADGQSGDGRPRDVPADLAIAAYARCVRVAGAVFDGILRDPNRAQWRLVGTYALMHGIEDSFSAAHVNRDAQLRILHLLSWKLIDWPIYFRHGLGRFPAATHHGVSDDRDKDYLLWKARAPDGRPCASLHHPYAVPEECLTPRARAAAAAVVGLLVALYEGRIDATGDAHATSLFSSEAARAGWVRFIDGHLASATVPAPLPERSFDPLPRSDIFVGLQGVAGRGALGLGLWTAKLFFVRPVIPFALGLSGSVVYLRASDADPASAGDARALAAGLGLNLLLPLVRRLTIGASPAGLRLGCDTGFDHCRADLVATAGVLLVPVGDAVWVGLEGPQYSWTSRGWGRTWFGLSVGWSHEVLPKPREAEPAAVAAWDPPRPDEVHAYRAARWSRALYMATTIGSEPDNAFVGAGLELRWDRDRWDRRGGLCPGIQVEAYEGTIDERASGGGIALAPTLRAYLVPDRISVVATPALLRFGALGGGEIGFDVGARGGIGFELGNIELTVDSSPLSYVARDLWRRFPVTLRLAALLD
jgi:hypothetical protein